MNKYLDTVGRALQTLSEVLQYEPYNLFKDGSMERVRPGSTCVCAEMCRLLWLCGRSNAQVNRKHGSPAAEPCSHYNQHLGIFPHRPMAETLDDVPTFKRATTPKGPSDFSR